jgi:hypothetical protein
MNYFLLVKPLALGPGKEARKLAWSLALYVATVVGVLGEEYFGKLAQPQYNAIGWRLLAFSAFVAAILLPAIWQSAQLNRRKPNFVSFLLCIQHGYFWKSIISHLAGAD